MSESLSRTVTCTGELLALICVISSGKDLIPPFLDYYIWYATQWFSCCLVDVHLVFVPCLCTILSTLCIGRSR